MSPRKRAAARSWPAKCLTPRSCWDTDVFSWHKVTFYGDYRKDFLNLAKLYSMKTIKEDRLNPGC